MVYPNVTQVNLTKDWGSHLLYYVNDVTDSWISRMILIALYMIILIGLQYYKKTDFVDSMAIAGWVTWVVAILFFFTGFIAMETLIFAIVVMILGTVLSFVIPRS